MRDYFATKCPFTECVPNEIRVKVGTRFLSRVKAGKSEINNNGWWVKAARRVSCSWCFYFITGGEENIRRSRREKKKRAGASALEKIKYDPAEDIIRFLNIVWTVSYLQEEQREWSSWGSWVRTGRIHIWLCGWKRVCEDSPAEARGRLCTWWR